MIKLKFGLFRTNLYMVFELQYLLHGYKPGCSREKDLKQMMRPLHKQFLHKSS